MEWYFYPILVLTGILVGFINTLAGAGSLITLPLLMYMGLPAGIANGTNRVAILLQSLVGAGSFLHQKVIRIRDGIWLSVPAIVGAVIGAFFAVDLNDALLKKIIGILLILMFFVIIINPETWIKGKTVPKKVRPGFWQVLIFFGIGLYGGFIQAGIGFFLLAGLVLGAGLDLIKANALKNLIVVLYTVFALAVFILNDQVNWPVGLTLASGNMLGAWLAARIAIKKGTRFIRVILLMAILAASLDMLGFFRLF